MTCKIERPEPQVLFDRILNMFSANVLGGAQVIPESNEWYVVSNDYAMQEQLYAIADQMWRETNPETACCENLVKMAARNGVYPMPATFAQGYAKLTGTAGATIPPNLEISTTIGVYVAAGTVPIQIGTDGTSTLGVRAITPGSAGNSAGVVTTGTITTPVVNIDSTAIICGGQLCGGGEAEECEAFRLRYLDRLAYKPRATSDWIKNKLLEFPCATRVCTREGTCCKCNPDCHPDCGCVGCGDKLQYYVFFDSSFPCGVPPLNIIEDIQLWMFGEHQGYGEGQAPVGVCGGIYQQIPFYVDVIIDIADCITGAEKAQIETDITNFFGKLCPSLPLYIRQLELIVANVIGAEVNAAVRLEVINYDRKMAWITVCGDIEPECDYLPCLNTISFTPPPETLRTKC